MVNDAGKTGECQVCQQTRVFGNHPSRHDPGLTDDTFSATFALYVHIVHKEGYHDASTRYSDR